MQKLKVELGSRSYDIVIDSSFERLADELAKVCSGKVLIVSDTHVAPLYKAEIARQIEKAGLVFAGEMVFEAGEKSKNIDVLQDIYKACINASLSRGDTLLALGGGVVGDIAGFASSSYMRGINFVQIPTTLLAQTDSSVGGKVGIDFADVKNIVGAFKQPKLVYINTSTLKTLPGREFAAGMAEVIKYGIIRDAAFLDFLEGNADKIKSLEADAVEKMIYNCCAIKADVVANDETENGLRAILNFGHTIGHGVESAKGFELLHGECVAIGMVGALRISKMRGYITDDEEKRCFDLIEKYDLDKTAKSLDAEVVLEYMKNDKKKVGNTLRFVLAKTIGDARVYGDVNKDETTGALELVLE